VTETVWSPAGRWDTIPSMSFDCRPLTPDDAGDLAALWTAIEDADATALLATALSAARAEGYDQASLGVDADSLTGAVRLYERVGFTVDNTRTAYQKQLR
jgi:GNAT superfamily N-acetyltransferase